MKHIYLTGMMGSGKSTLGRLLAKQKKLDFIDLDTFIEHQQRMTISEIFFVRGEGYFRNLENEALEKVSQYEKPHIIATGGGVVENPRNRDLMRTTGIILYLDVDIEMLVKRLRNTTHRPLLANMTVEDLRSKLTSLLQKREMFYQDSSISVTSAGRPHETILNIQRILQKK